MSVLGWFGSILVVASLAQDDVRRIRVLNLAASVVLLAFNASIGVLSMTALNGVLVGINVHHLLRDARRTARGGRAATADGSIDPLTPARHTP